MCGYLPLTESGETIRIQELERFMPHSMPSAALRALARDPGKHVLALAASAEKLEALCLALHARLCNTIVIDEPLAIAMLEGLSAESVSSEDAHRSIPGNSTKPAQ
jgi:DNA-binding transcriptional regulator LsrR (DeoR family)